MPDTSRVRVAVVGAGWVSTVRHVPTLRRTKGATIVGAIDRSGERVERLAARYRIPRSCATTDLASVPWLREVDALTIGTAPSSHFELCRQALALGKHVIMEKPMTLAPHEAEQLRELARAKGLTLAIVHNFQFTRSFQALRALIDAGLIGEITGVAATQLSSDRRRLPEWYEELPWGLFYDESPHLLYLLRSLYPALELHQATVWASASGKRTPGLVTAHYRAPHGPPITLYMNFESSISEWHLIVYGTRMTAAVDVFRDILVTMPCDRAHSPGDILRTTLHAGAAHLFGVISSGVRHVTGNQLYGNPEVFARFIAAVRDGSDLRPVSGDDGLAVLRMQHDLMSSATVFAAPRR